MKKIGTEIIPDCAFLMKSFLVDHEQFAAKIIDETFHAWEQQWSMYSRPGRSLARFSSDPRVTYSYKGKKKRMWPMCGTLAALQKIVENSIDWYPNCAVINSYEAQSTLYPHRDGLYIPELGPQPVIASVSFGASRVFALHRLDERGKRIKGEETRVTLDAGDLFVMYGKCDELYHHSIPDPGTGTRVSVTFRKHIVINDN